MRFSNLLFVFGSLAVSLCAGTARATSEFPDAIRAKVGASSAPACAVCHVTGDRGGRGTVSTAFGRAMRERGLVEFDVQSLESALDKMATDKIDSNGNGTTDVDELKAGRDPNSTSGDGGAAVEIPMPEYGCTQAPVRATNDVASVASSIAMVALAFVGALRRRKSA